MIPRDTYYQEHNIMVEPLIKIETRLIIYYRSHQRNIPPIPRTWYTPGSTNYQLFLFVSPKEHTTDPENMVYTWFDNYIFIINSLLSKLPDFTCHRSREHDMLLQVDQTYIHYYILNKGITMAGNIRKETRIITHPCLVHMLPIQRTQHANPQWSSDCSEWEHTWHKFSI